MARTTTLTATRTRTRSRKRRAAGAVGILAVLIGLSLGAAGTAFATYPPKAVCDMTTVTVNPRVAC